MNIEATYNPSGYRHLGLWSPVVGTYRTNSSATRLRARLERHEHEHGLPAFQAHHLDELPAALAFDYTHTYLGLRRRWNGIEVDHIDFAARIDKLAGLSYPYRTNWPALHHLARSTGTIDYTELLEHQQGNTAEDATCPTGQTLHNEAVDVATELRWAADLACVGNIALTACFAHPRCYAKTCRTWNRRSAIATRRGSTLYVPEFRTTMPALVLVHEYGHLVEAAIWNHSDTLAEAVWGELSEELTGTVEPSTNQWAQHLINYKAWTQPPGPAQGGTTRQRQRARTLRAGIGNRLGRYALASREEIFAEAFTFAICGHDPALRRRFRRIQDLCADAGIARRPRR